MQLSGSTRAQKAKGDTEMKRRVIFIFLVTLALSIVDPAVAGATFGELSFVEPEKVAVTYSGGASKEVSVWLKNGGSQKVTPKFATVLENGEGAPVEATVKVVDASGEAEEAAALGAGQVGRYRLVIESATKSSGQLVATAPEIAPASVPLALGPDLPARRGITAALLVPLVFALLVLAFAWIKGHGTATFASELGGVTELDFGKSFATTLTAVGALLGTIIGASVLPEETVHISRSGLVGLNLTFGVAIAIAAGIAASVLKSEAVKGKEKNEWQVKGKVWTFMLAALITLWAVAGELYTINLLIEELGVGEGFNQLGVWMLRVLLAAGTIGLIPYTLTKVKVAVQAPVPTEPSPPASAAAPARVLEVQTAEAVGGDKFIAVEVPTEAAPVGEPPTSSIPLL